MKTLTNASSLQPTATTTVKQFDLTISERPVAINLMRQLERIYKKEWFAVLPAANDQWRICNYNLLNDWDKAWIDAVRELPEYYEEIN